MQSTVSTPPDRADSIPTIVSEIGLGENIQTRWNVHSINRFHNPFSNSNPSSSNVQSKVHEKNLEEKEDNDGDNEEDGQKLEESSVAQISGADEQPEDSQNQTPKAVPIPPSATEEAPARLHPKQLAIDKMVDKKEEEPLRQYGAKTIVRQI